MSNDSLIFPPTDSENQTHTILEDVPLTDLTRIRSKRLREIFHFWQDNLGVNRVPAWSTFDPMGFTDLLPAISVYSNEGTLEQPDFLLRLEGELSAKFFNVPTTMTKVSEIQTHKQKDYLVNHLATAIRQGEPSYIVRNLGWNKGRNYIEYEILSLPFDKNNNGIANKVLCAKVFRNKFSSLNS
ncbi:PAS domain-containing protein [Emcibacter nanhaiensis]|uniref:PAS domain-containing protein n=1 Tax=Emcibacter nanhaiensis TaxID=1505037 RepID=A0A501PQ84_9PROT|nr:PAS domain-containing protein [Emcibacter nanhaiensis]TPD61946.1 PAS domain-containing protein [Emcibacter nanhaiensis]